MKRDEILFGEKDKIRLTFYEDEPDKLYIEVENWYDSSYTEFHLEVHQIKQLLEFLQKKEA